MTDISTSELMHVYGAFGAGVDYTVRLTVRLTDLADPALLAEALAKTQERYPYFSVRLMKNTEAFYYEENPRPIALIHGDRRISLGTEETNCHLWAVCYMEDRVHLDFFHGLTDGDGMYRVLATLLYYYCAGRYGTEWQEGIGLITDQISGKELADPLDALPLPDVSTLPVPQMEPAFTLETDGGLTRSAPTIWDIEIPEDAFIRFTSAHDSSPGTMVSLLLAKAIDSLYPERNKKIISAYVVNARQMLHVKETYHLCLSMAFLDYSDRIKKMPMTEQCTIYRGKTFAQTYDPLVTMALAGNAAQIKAALQAAATVEDKKNVFTGAFNGGEGVVSFLVSYVGKWKYPAIGAHIREFWTHPSNTFGLMVEIAAAGGRIFLSIQQRFREDCIREAFLEQLDAHGIPFVVRRVMENDVAHLPEPE